MTAPHAFELTGLDGICFGSAKESEDVLEVGMQVIRLREPCYVQQRDGDVKHLPVELCRKLFGWESACQSLEIFIHHEIPNVEFYAVVEVQEEGITLASTGKLGIHHYFIPWSNIVAVHGHIAT